MIIIILILVSYYYFIIINVFIKEYDVFFLFLLFLLLKINVEIFTIKFVIMTTGLPYFFQNLLSQCCHQFFINDLFLLQLSVILNFIFLSIFSFSLSLFLSFSQSFFSTENWLCYENYFSINFPLKTLNNTQCLFSH